MPFLSIRFQWVVLTSLLLLSLPGILFLAGWFEWYVSLPLIVGSAIGTRKVVALSRSWSWELSKTDVLKLLLVFLLILLHQFTVGYTGHVLQHGDFWQRNAFYGNLISYAWPIILPDGSEMMYYLSGWLPAALICKMLAHLGVDVNCIWGAPGYVLLLWNIATLFMAALFLFRLLGKVSISALLWVYIFGGIMVFLSKLPVLSGWLQVSPETRIAPVYWNLAAGLPGSVHILPYTALGAVMILMRNWPFWVYFLLGAFLFLITPLGAVGAFPFVICQAWASLKERKSLNKHWVFHVLHCGYFYLAVALCAAGVVYFTRAESSSCYWSFHVDSRPSAWLVYWIYLIINIYVVTYLPWRCDKKNPFLHVAWLTLCVLPLFYMGDIFNELPMKAATVPVVVLAVLWCSSFFQCRSALRDPIVWVIVCVFCLKFAGHLWNRVPLVVKSFGHTEYNVVDPFHGHLYHPGTCLNQSVRSTREPMLPHVLLRIAGASEKGVLFWVQTLPSNKYFTAPYTERAGCKHLGVPVPNQPQFVR